MEKGIAPLLAASAAMPPSPPIRFVPVHMARCTVQKQPKNRGGVHGYFLGRWIYMIAILIHIADRS
jgi:hypothetical protein